VLLSPEIRLFAGAFVVGKMGAATLYPDAIGCGDRPGSKNAA